MGQRFPASHSCAVRGAWLVARGGVEAHGGEVLDHAPGLGLHVQDISLQAQDLSPLAYCSQVPVVQTYLT
jgi:hypothetical protein